MKLEEMLTPVSDKEAELLYSKQPDHTPVKCLPNKRAFEPVDLVTFFNEE